MDKSNALLVVSKHYMIESGETGILTSLNHIQLIDILEKGYYAKDDVREICIRSEAVFSGYLEGKVETREALDDNDG